MRLLDDELDGDDDADIAFRDMILLTLGALFVVAALMFPHLNVKAKANSEAAGLEPPGNVIVEARWADALDTDVDLWVQGPQDVPVGYSNKGGQVFNLLRDDLGQRADATKLNYEVSYSRGIPPGEYVVNLHLYRNVSRTVPITITVVASVKRTAQESAKQLLATKVDLRREGQEQTVFRFRLDDKGDLVAGSVNSLNKPLRSWKPT